MPWGKGTVVTGAKGFVFLAGNTATTDDYEPFSRRRRGRAVAHHTCKHQVRSGGTRHLAGPPDQAYVFRERTVPRRRRVEFSKLPSGRDGRVLCPALPKAAQLQQPSTFGGHRGCRTCASRPRHRDRSGRGIARLAASHQFAPWKACGAQPAAARERRERIAPIFIGHGAPRPHGRALSKTSGRSIRNKSR
jgi:hypothetical protein